MEIMPVQATQVNIDPGRRDYSPMAKAAAARQQFFQSAFTQLADVSLRITQTIQSNNLRKGQNEATRAMADMDREFRNTVIQMRVQDEPEERIGEYIETARSQVFDNIERGFRAPGVRSRFREWSENSWLNYSLGAQTKINTELMALNQYNAGKQRQEIIGTTNLQNYETQEQELRMYHGQLQAEGTYSPAIGQRLLDEDLYRLNEQLSLSAGLEVIQSGGTVEDAMSAVSAADEQAAAEMSLGSESRERIEQRLSAEYDVRVERVRRQSISAAELAEQNILQSMIAYDNREQGSQPPMHSEDIDGLPEFQAQIPEVQQMRTRVKNAVSQYWNGRREAAQQREIEAQEMEVARTEAEAAEIAAAEEARIESMRQELTLMYTDEEVGPWEYIAKLYEYGPQIGLSESEIRTRINAAPSKNMEPPLRAAYQTLLEHFDRRMSGADDEEVQSIIAERERMISEFYRLRTSDFYQGNDMQLIEAMDKLLQNSIDRDVAERIRGLSQLENDGSRYRSGRFMDSAARNDVESLQMAIDEGELLGRVGEFLDVGTGSGQLVRLAEGYNEVINSMSGLRRAGSDPFLIDPSTGRVVFNFTPTGVVPGNYVYRASLGGGGDRPVFSLSFKTIDNDTQLVIWNPRLSDWEPINDLQMPRLYNVARGAGATK